MKTNLIYGKIYTLLKVQYSNMLEYRVEIALWAISGVIPFFMLNIWTNNGLNESINISDVMLSRYFLCAFFVRQFSVFWVYLALRRFTYGESISLFNTTFKSFSGILHNICGTNNKTTFCSNNRIFLFYVQSKVYGFQILVFYSYRQYLLSYPF